MTERKPKIPLGVILATIAVVVLGVVAYSRSNLINSQKTAVPSQTRQPIQSTPLADRRDRESRRGENLRSYVHSQMVKAPFTSRGINESSQRHFNLSEEQAKSIAELGQSLRTKVTSDIVSQLEESSEPGIARRLFIFKASPSLFKDTNDELRSKIKAITGDDELAELALNGLRGDSKFMGAGRMNIYFYIDPNFRTDTSTSGTIRYELRGSDNRLAEHWEGSIKTFQESFGIEFE